MTTVTGMGSPEGRLCGHLAAALSKFVAERPSNEAGEKGRRVRFLDMSDWSAAESALAAIGVMEEIPEKSKAGWRIYVFSMDAVDMPNFLANSMPADDREIDRLIEAFIGIACGYGIEMLSDERGWFQPSPHYQIAMQWLARAGFAEQSGEEFRWTDRIGPAMRANYFWNNGNESLATIRDAEEENECKLIWESMPDTFRQAILSGRVSCLELIKWLALGWKDGEWQQFRSDERIALRGEVTTRAKRILDCVESGAWK